MWVTVESLCCTLETRIVLYISYSKKKFLIIKRFYPGKKKEKKKSLELPGAPDLSVFFPLQKL